MKFFSRFLYLLIICTCIYLFISPAFVLEPSASPEQIHEICRMAKECPECFRYLKGTYEFNGYLGESELILIQRAHKRHVEAEQKVKEQAAIDKAMKEVTKLLYKN